MAVDAEGRITAIDIDDLTGIGPYSVYPRTSAVEGNQVVNLIGGPYDFANYRAKTTVVLQNKTPTCQYRAVGHPIATAVTEGPRRPRPPRRMGLDPVEFRRRNLMQRRHLPAHLARRHEVRGPLATIARSHKLLGDDRLPGPARRAGAAARASGIHRGIGFASFIELTNPSPFMYGIGGARISAQDGCTVRIDPDGSVMAATGVTEQGQGTEAIIRQIVAEAVGVPIDAGARHHRRHAHHALRRRHLGLPRRRHRRRGGAAGGPSPSRRPRSRWPAPCCRRRPTRSTSSTARSSTRRRARRACRSPSSPASSTSAATRCRPTCRAS